MDQIFPPDGGGSIADRMPKDYMRSPMEISEDDKKRMMEKPYRIDPEPKPDDKYGDPYPNKPTGKPMREKSPQDYEKKRGEEKDAPPAVIEKENLLTKKTQQRSLNWVKV